ncbi:MAG: type III secretion system outer membrane ring subunit SctC [Aquisalinus sp.]|nr:type III secretion system outer membrane ring subunit SctC [Aquisalinus sp.]
MKQIWLCVVTLLIVGAFSTDSWSADIPFASTYYEANVREEPIEDFLQSMFWKQGLSVSVNETVSGKINGKFSGEPAVIFDNISKAYGLIPFYDGSLVHIYSAGDLQKEIYNLDPDGARHIKEISQELGLLDRHHRLSSTSDGALIVSGTPAFVNQVGQLVDVLEEKKASIRQSQDHLRVFPLNYAWADDRSFNSGEGEVLVPGVASILRSIISDTIGQQVLEPSPRDSQEDTARTNSTVTSALDRAAAERSERPQPQAIQGYLPNQPRIEADVRLNAVIVRDSIDRMPMYEQFIKTLDVAPQLVEIQATILDVDMQKITEKGVQWRFFDDQGRFDVTSVASPGGLPLDAQNISNPFANGLLASGIVGDNDLLAVRVAALQQEGLAKIVSRPQILTLSNVEAVFNNLETLFLPVFGEREVDLFDVSAGTELRVTPHVIQHSSTPSIRLVVNVRDGQVIDRGAASGVAGGGAGASIVESGVNTTALINVGESLLIGGMTINETEQIENKVPGLGNIPLLGRAFRSTTDANRRFERLILITPRLITDQASQRQPVTVREEINRNPSVYSSNLQYPQLTQQVDLETTTGQNAPQAPARPVNASIEVEKRESPFSSNTEHFDQSYCRTFRRCGGK